MGAAGQCEPQDDNGRFGQLHIKEAAFAEMDVTSVAMPRCCISFSGWP